MTKDFWIVLFDDGISIFGRVYGHNPIADFRGFPTFRGVKKVTINLEELQR